MNECCKTFAFGSNVRRVLFSHQAARQTPAACESSLQLCPGSCLCSSSAKSTEDTDGNTSGAKITGKVLERETWPIGRALCLTRTLELGPDNNDYKLAVVWVYSASCSHFQMLGAWEGPRPHFVTQFHCLVRSFQGKW